MNVWYEGQHVCKGMVYVQYRLEAFFVYGHLDCDVGEVVVDEFIWTGADCRVVLGVFVEVSDGTDATRMRLRLLGGKEMNVRHANVLDYLEGKKLGK